MPLLGTLIASAFAFALGLYGGYAYYPPTLSMAANPQPGEHISIADDVPTNRCSERDVESQHHVMKYLDDELMTPYSRPRDFVKDADKIWVFKINCANSSELSQHYRDEYSETMLLGNADCVVVYFDAARYSDARAHVSEYLEYVNRTRPIAQAEGWEDWLELEPHETKIVNKYDTVLKHLQHP